MAKKDPRVEAVVAKAAPFAQPILRRVRQLIHQAVPEIEEDLKWRMPAFTYRGDIFAILAPFKKHCIFILWRHKLLKKQLNPAEQKLLKNFRRLTSAAELPKATILLKLLKATRQLHATGAKPTQPKAGRKAGPSPFPIFLKRRWPPMLGLARRLRHSVTAKKRTMSIGLLRPRLRQPANAACTPRWGGWPREKHAIGNISGDKRLAVSSPLAAAGPAGLYLP